MPLTKISAQPKVLVIEFPDPSQNILLTLENLEESNKCIKDSINDTNIQLDWIKKLLDGL